MIAVKIFRIILCVVFILVYVAEGFKSFTASSVRSGLLDAYLFISSSPSDIRNYKSADFHTALALWAFSGLRLPSLSIDDIYELAYERPFKGKNKYLINEKVICVSNDHSCEENYLLRNALDTKNYPQIFNIWVEQYIPGCGDSVSICLFLKSFFDRITPVVESSALRPKHEASVESEVHATSYIPFGGYHFDELKSGDIIRHKRFRNIHHSFHLYLIKSKGKIFKNFTSKTVYKRRGSSVEFDGMLYELHKGVEEVDVIFVKSSYGRGFPYIGAYGPLNRVEKWDKLSDCIERQKDIILCSP